MYKDTLTNMVRFTRPKLTFEQFENEKGVVLCSKNVKKVLVPTTRGYLKQQMEMYSISQIEKGYIYDLLNYLTNDNLLCCEKLPLSPTRYAHLEGISEKSAYRGFSSLVKKNVLRKIRTNDATFYMLNPIFGCFRNCISYKTYFVFMKELNMFFSNNNQEYRLENIEKHLDIHLADVERKVKIL